MIASRSLSALCALALLPGCSKSLQVTPISAVGPRTGVGYVLPFTQYAMAITWRLDYCPDPANLAAQGGIEARIALKVDAASGSADDGNLAFLVNPQDLQSISSITTFSAKWHDGRNLFSTINASVEDRSAQIIGNLVKTAVKVLPLAMGIPAPGATPTTSTPILCTDDARKALINAKAAKAGLDAASDLVEGATETVTALAAKVAVMGTAIDDGTKKKFADAIDALTVAKARQAEAAESLAGAIKPITFTRKFQWPLDGDTFSHGPIEIDGAMLDKWVVGGQASGVGSPVFLQIERQGTFGRQPSRLDLTSAAQRQLEISDPALRSPIAVEAGDTSYADSAITVKGLRYRMPAAGRLVACSRSPCGSLDPDAVLAKFDGPVVQLGYVNVLPFRSRAFGSNSFSAEFALDGSLKAVGYEQKAAPAEVATGALADAAGQIAGVFDPTARLQAGTTYLTALKARRDAVEALKEQIDDPAVTEKAALDVETSLLNARLANLQAEIALEELKAKQSQ